MRLMGLNAEAQRAIKITPTSCTVRDPQNGSRNFSMGICSNMNNKSDLVFK